MSGQLVDGYEAAHLQIFKVGPVKYAIFTESGAYLETLDYD